VQLVRAAALPAFINTNTLISSPKLSGKRELGLRKIRATRMKMKNMTIDCPYSGCSGIIDLSKEFAGWPYRGRTPVLVHTIRCPKCLNPVGGMELGANPWFDPETKKKHIYEPKTGKDVKVSEKNMNKYLKRWARFHP